MEDEDLYSVWKDRCDRYFIFILELESVRNGNYEKNRYMKKWRMFCDVISDDLIKLDVILNFDWVRLWFFVVDIYGFGIVGIIIYVLEIFIWIIIFCVVFSGFVFFVYLNFLVYYL